MKLYSIQPLAVYEQLCAGTPFVSDPFRDEGPHARDPWRPAYEWLGCQMKKRGILPPAHVEFPVWAWYQWGGEARRRPDLRVQSLKNWAAESPYVMLTLDVPDSAVLLSDYDAWHWPLNYWYLAPEAEADAFEARCENEGFSYYTHKPLPQQALHEDLIKSWEAIFDIERCAPIIEQDVSQAIIQATFWELRPEYVQSARQFGGGQRAKYLPKPPLLGAAR